MTDLEPPLLRHWTGLRIVAVSLGLGAVGLLPLMLYALLGPSDGNPVGLGLLAMAACAVATIGVLIGLISLVIEIFLRERR